MRGVGQGECVRVRGGAPPWHGPEQGPLICEAAARSWDQTHQLPLEGDTRRPGDTCVQNAVISKEPMTESGLHRKMWTLLCRRSHTEWD